MLRTDRSSSTICSRLTIEASSSSTSSSVRNCQPWSSASWTSCRIGAPSKMIDRSDITLQLRGCSSGNSPVICVLSIASEKRSKAKNVSGNRSGPIRSVRKTGGSYHTPALKKMERNAWCAEGHAQILCFRTDHNGLNQRRCIKKRSTLRNI